MIELKTSRKVTVISLVAMMSVVAIHSHAIGTMENPERWLEVTQTLLFRAMTSWAVPFFFVVSGYFFARGTYCKRGGGYIPFIATKARTLLVPYLLWTIIGTAIAMPLYMGNNLIMHRGLLERTFLANGFGWAAVDSFFGITKNGPAGNLALWYVRTLMVFFLLAPIWKLAANVRWLPIAAGLILVIGCPMVFVPGLEIKAGSVGWLLLGIGIAETGWDERNMPGWVWMAAGGVYLAASIGAALGQEWLKPAIQISGVMFWWGLGEMLIKQDKELPQLCRMTFWVYSMHGVITGYFLSGTLFVLGKNSLGAMAASVLSIAGVLTICLTAGVLVKRRWPKIYGVLSGGR